MKFNEKNFKESKQKIIKIVDGISMKEIIRRMENKRYLGWFFDYTIDICFLLLAPFNFKISRDDIHDVVKAMGHRYKDKNSIAKSLWQGTLRSKSHGWPTKSLLDSYMDSRLFSPADHSDEKKFFEWQETEIYFRLFVDNNEYSRDVFIMLKIEPNTLKEVFQLAWWIGKELENIEEK